MSPETERGEVDEVVAVEEILSDSTRRQFVSNLAAFRLVLRQLSKLIIEGLTTIREEHDEGIQHRYSWDWEMIREFIEFEHRGAYFAAPLMIALKSGMKQGVKVLVLEGAKREAARYLRRLVTRERRIEEAARKRREKPHKAGVFKHKSWRSELSPSIAILKERHMPVFVLEWFLQNRAIATEEYLDAEQIRECVPFLFSEAEHREGEGEEEIDECLSTLSGLRSGGIRNESDAANLSLISAINAKAESTRWRLVTGTKLLRKVWPESTVSPVSFAVIMALREQYDDRTELEEYLNDCNARISQLLSQLGIEEQAMRRKPRDITRQDIANISGALQHLENDPTLERLSRLLANATTAAHNEFQLMRCRAEEKVVELVPLASDVSSYYALASAVERIYRQLFEGREVGLEELGIQWDSHPLEVGLARQWKLRDQKSERELLTLDVYDDCYSIYWKTRAPAEAFVRSVNALLAAAGAKTAQVRIVFQHRPSVDQPVNGKAELESILSSVNEDDRIARIVIITKLGDFYYGVPCMDRESLERVFLKGDIEAELGFEREPQVAIVSNLGDPNAFEALYQGTYLEFLPDGVFPTEMVRKLSEAGWQCDMNAEAEKGGPA